MSMELSLVGWAKILNFKTERCNIMKTRKCRLEFGINCLADIRFLYHAWDRLWTHEGGVPPQSILVYLTIEDRLPGDQVCMNFTAELEVLDRFLSSLEKDGLKFTRNEFIPGFLIMCRVEKDKGGLTVIGAKDAHEPGEEPEG
jgi:hypothetical protein